MLGPIRPDLPLGSQQELVLQDAWARSSILPPNQDAGHSHQSLRALRSIPRSLLGFLLDEEFGLRSDSDDLPSWIDPLLQPNRKDADQLNQYLNALTAWVVVLPRGSGASGIAGLSGILTIKDAETPAQEAAQRSDNESSDILTSDSETSSSDSSENLSSHDSVYSPEDASEFSSQPNPVNVAERPSRNGADVARERIRTQASLLNTEPELPPKGPKPLNKHQKPRLKDVLESLLGRVLDESIHLSWLRDNSNETLREIGWYLRPNLIESDMEQPKTVILPMLDGSTGVESLAVMSISQFACDAILYAPSGIEARENLLAAYEKLTSSLFDYDGVWDFAWWDGDRKIASRSVFQIPHPDARYGPKDLCLVVLAKVVEVLNVTCAHGVGEVLGIEPGVPYHRCGEHTCIEEESAIDVYQMRLVMLDTLLKYGKQPILRHIQPLESDAPKTDIDPIEFDLEDEAAYEAAYNSDETMYGLDVESMEGINEDSTVLSEWDRVPSNPPSSEEPDPLELRLEKSAARGLKIKPGHVKQILDAMGPPQATNLLPVHIEVAIGRHKRWMREILMNTVNAAIKQVAGTSEKFMESSTITFLLANRDEESQELIISILTDPRIRSVRLQAMLGLQAWSPTVYDQFLAPINVDSAGTIKYIGVYEILMVRPSHDSTASANFRYIGSGTAAQGLGERLLSHQKTFKLGKERIDQKRASQKTSSVLWVHSVGSMPGMERRFFCVGSFPRVEDDECLYLTKKLVLLLEGLHMVYQSSLTTHAHFRGHPFHGLSSRLLGKLRPIDMPKPSCEGTNVVLALTQSGKVMRKSFLTPAVVESFHNLVKDRENKLGSMRLRKPDILSIQEELSLPPTPYLTRRLWEIYESLNWTDENKLLRRCSSFQEACYVYRAVILYAEKRHLVTGPVDGFYMLDEQTLDFEPISHIAKSLAPLPDKERYTKAKARELWKSHMWGERVNLALSQANWDTLRVRACAKDDACQSGQSLADLIDGDPSIDLECLIAFQLQDVKQGILQEAITNSTWNQWGGWQAQEHPWSWTIKKEKVNPSTNRLIEQKPWRTVPEHVVSADVTDEPMPLDKSLDNILGELEDIDRLVADLSIDEEQHQQQQSLAQVAAVPQETEQQPALPNHRHTKTGFQLQTPFTRSSKTQNDESMQTGEEKQSEARFQQLLALQERNPTQLPPSHTDKENDQKLRDSYHRDLATRQASKLGMTVELAHELVKFLAESDLTRVRDQSHDLLSTIQNFITEKGLDRTHTGLNQAWFQAAKDENPLQLFAANLRGFRSDFWPEESRDEWLGIAVQVANEVGITECETWTPAPWTRFASRMTFLALQGLGFTTCKYPLSWQQGRRLFHTLLSGGGRVKQSNSRGMLQCPFCTTRVPELWESKKFQELSNHIKAEHPGQKVTCQFCRKSFEHLGPFVQHTCTKVIVHEGKKRNRRVDICQICCEEFQTPGLRLTTISDLQKHMEEAHGPLKCESCDREFKEPLHLDMHRCAG
ncbi:hypothetical protein N0V84_000376 [Fusarium piperis]|uniref:C2H2-type domain-containing protein n=1 Tax=Fusarium piperis TaxID=1435070 RepID=A0A9W8WP40_9HYPO|nr:hypothetical protein N0V84_000376 [Fusarium piperis]